MKALRTISIVLLGLLVLVASTSFQVGLHYCKGKVADIAIFGKAGGCEMERQMPPCHRHLADPCCEDETIVHESSDFQASSEHLHLETPVPVQINYPLLLIAEIIPSSSEVNQSFIHYQPPLRSSDLSVVHRTLLI